MAFSADKFLCWELSSNRPDEPAAPPRVGASRRTQAHAHRVSAEMVYAAPGAAHASQQTAIPVATADANEPRTEKHNGADAQVPSAIMDQASLSPAGQVTAAEAKNARTVGVFQKIESTGARAHVDFPGRKGACPEQQDIAFARSSRDCSLSKRLRAIDDPGFDASRKCLGKTAQTLKEKPVKLGDIPIQTRKDEKEQKKTNIKGLSEKLKEEIMTGKFKNVGQVVDALHHANLHMQTEQTIFKLIEKYNELAKKLLLSGSPGVKWKEMGSQKPEKGKEIQNEALAAKLQQKQLEFTEEELDGFEIDRICYNNFIESGGSYFKPAHLEWERCAGKHEDGSLDDVEKELQLLEDFIVRYSIPRVLSQVEERSETHEKRDKYLETGPVGETPVHLAFLFEEGDNNHLGKRMVTSAARLHAFQEVFKKLCKQPGDGQLGDYVLKGELVGMQALTCDRGDSCDACKNIKLRAKIDLIMPSGSSRSDAEDPILKLRVPENEQDLYSIDLIKLSIDLIKLRLESYKRATKESWESIQESEADTEPNITLTIEIQGCSMILRFNDCSMILRFKQDIELVPGSDSVCPNAKLCFKLHITLDGSVALSGSPGETDTSFKDKDDLLKWASVTYASKMEDIINMPYRSDLEFWLNDVDKWIRGPMNKEEEDDLGRQDFITALSEWANLRAGTGDKISDAFKQARYLVCNGDEKATDSVRGRDGGLFTGETVLHIAIVQKKHHSVTWLLERGAHLDARARGKWFQPLMVKKYDADTSFALLPVFLTLLTFTSALAFVATWLIRPVFWASATIWLLVATSSLASAFILSVLALCFTFISLRSREYQTSKNKFSRGCSFGEYPLSFAASVGERKICGKLLGAYRERNKRMLDVVQAFKENRTRTIAGKVFTDEESKKLTEGCSVRGFLLFTEDDVLLRACSIMRRRSLMASCWRSWAQLLPGKGQECVKDGSPEPIMEELAKASHDEAKDAKNKAEEWEKQHDDKALHDDYQDSLELDFLNKQSVHGDSALHIAVRYGHQNVMDWLIDAGANDSMHILNIDNLTPLTLAARYAAKNQEASGDNRLGIHISVLKHLVAFEEEQKWQFGSVYQRFTNLEFIDTFRTKASKHKHVHRKDNWKSALEVVVTHEVKDCLYSRDGTSDGGKWSLFEHLIDEKWQAFGKKFHCLFTILPHVIVLGMYMTLVMVRVTLVYERRSGYRFPGPLRIPGEVLELNEFQLWFAPTTIGVSLFILIGHALAERRFKYTDLDPDEDQKIRLQEFITFIYKNFGSLLNFCASACLVAQAALWSQTRDLFDEDWPDLFDDSWPDDQMPERLNKALNLWRDEYWIMALVTLLLWCRMLNCLLPFRCLYRPHMHSARLALTISCHFTHNHEFIFGFTIHQEKRDIICRRSWSALVCACLSVFVCALTCMCFARFTGMMQITIFRMLMSDVAKWFSVFIFLLIAFSFSSFIINLDTYLQNGNEVQRKDENVINHTLKYFYTSLGDFAFNLNGTPFMRTMHAAYVILSNLLMVNLIIAMMGDTFAKDKQADGYRMWWMMMAHTVLRYERQRNGLAAALQKATQWIVVDDDEACDVHGTGSGGAHGMRGDGVGVGDIGEVHGDARGAGDTAAGDDGGGAGRRERGAYGAALRKATQWIGPDRSGFDIKPFEKEAEDQRPWYTLSRDLPIHTEGMKELEETSQRHAVTQQDIREIKADIKEILMKELEKTSQRHTVTQQDIEKVQADIKEILKAVRNNQELSGAGRGSQEQSGAVVISQGQSRAQVSSIHMSP